MMYGYGILNNHVPTLRAAMSGGGGAGTDADALLFITNAVITNTTQQNAIIQLVNKLKTDNIWNKMKAIYPFVGGTASQHSFNLKDPRPLPIAFHLSFNGGGTHSSLGYSPGGATGYANTNLTPNGTLSLNSSHFSYYSRTNVLEPSIEMMSTSGDPATIDMYIRFTNGNMLSRIANSSSFQTSNPSSVGFFMMNRIDSNTLKQYKNRTLLGTSSSSSSTSLPTRPIWLSAGLNNFNTSFGFSTKECAFSTIGDGLTDTESYNLYDAIQAFQVSLGGGRAV